MKMSDDFEPKRRLTLDERLELLEKSEAERQKLEQTRYTIRTTGSKSDLERVDEKLKALKEKQEPLIADVIAETEILKQNKEPSMADDEHEQLINECVGYAYGLAIYVDDNGELLYRASQEDVVELGETAEIETLRPFDELPGGEQDMILRYLMEQEDTPKWFVERMRKEGKGN